MANSGTDLLPLKKLQAAQNELHRDYHSASPYPHLVIDDYFDPLVLDRICHEFPAPEIRDWLHWKSIHEDKTTSRGINGLPAFTQSFFRQLNSDAFISLMQRITGLDDLVGDPGYLGAGLQETFRGGWLNVHRDWTRHRRLPLARRLTLLLYLNRDWDSAWNGDIELWNEQGSGPAVSYAPLFNRMLLFPARPDTLHGQPGKLACPSHRSRRFVSVYYWTADPEAVNNAMGIRWLWPDGRFPDQVGDTSTESDGVRSAVDQDSKRQT